ncbi:hypothetical protein [Spirosoma aerolatum]|uniref:hypothetical protein n=1 Tax=Spirosoma aerolatum TaxID=1211326 RepID=UPI0009AD0447|nr:hypothetical protein [Spirosoma aerolatum]
MKKSTSAGLSYDTLRDQRNAKIRAEFFRMHDVEGKRNEVIYALLSQKYFLAADTIERIVFQRGRYRSVEGGAIASQLNLFDASEGQAA